MKEESTGFFQEFIVWKRIDDTQVLRYRCLKVLPDDGYYVKAADHLHWPLDQKQISQVEYYFIDSLFHSGLESIRRKKLFPTVEEAIAFFEEGFE
jgi:hypothetical protein